MIKRILRASLLCFLLLFATTVGAQIETNPTMRQVVASGGGSSDFTWGAIDFTIGEAIITSVSVTPSDDFPGFEWLTQGFQQPDNGLVVSTEGGIVNSSCKGGNNGRVTIKVINATGLVNFTISGPSSATISSIAEDSSAIFKDLAPGDYNYTAKDDKQEVRGTFKIEENSKDCKLDQIYNGITANGDGVNDAWIIDSITHFNPNTVSIFNRWGNLVWKKANYNNEDVVWRGTNQNDTPLPGGTYFYIIEAGTEIRKGWVEVTTK
jgi:gliding motility-associated-like protein